MDRAEAITRIREALKRRSGKTWSVRGNTGTAWGWIDISAPPRRCDEYGRMTDQDRAELAALLGYASADRMPRQGDSVPSGSDYYREYVDRAEGRKPSVVGTPYWD